MEDQINDSTPSVLAVARQNLDILSTHGESDTLTYWDIVRSILDLFRTSLSAQDVLKALELGWEGLRMKNELSPGTMPMKRLILARSATLCMARQGVRVTGLWEDAVQVVITHVRGGDPIFIKNVFTSNPLKQWILTVFSDADFCPNYNIRLDLLTIICTWEQFEANEGKSVLSGLMQLSVYLDADEHLVPNAGVPSLEVPWFAVMCNLSKGEHLNDIYKKALIQMETLSVGGEARWLNRVVELVSARTEVAKKRLAVGWLRASDALLVLESSLVLLAIFVFSSRSIETFSCRGLLQVAAVALIKITTSIVDMIPSLRTYIYRCMKMVDTVDHILKVVITCPRLQSLVSTLRKDHGEELDRISQHTYRMGIPLQFLPEAIDDDTTINCPERFVDSLTFSVMEAPVLLKTSQVTVDEATLLYLLLQEPSLCPFTRTPLHHDDDSFCRLPDLQHEIQVWRASQSSPDTPTSPKTPQVESHQP
ncbi:hypothetical protein Pcinc_043433 [Petrolisthes cinctipes]|uniref:U-box domain-containing protein n=1 Tax=Petrolisthes cinctipes TaxID=88211 RepID=A0AAE1EG94_PETCI|nr:hypothetical protein Pcinc_043433 [Petrolisthes cinctipes]